MARWSELEAQGIKRCCAHFNDGSRCRRRASASGAEPNFCEKHAPAIAASRKQAHAAIEAEKNYKPAEDEE